MNNHSFSPEELSRYSRHIAIPEFNIEGQQKLKEAKEYILQNKGATEKIFNFIFKTI